DAVVLGRPHREAPPPASDVEHGLAGPESELATHQVELVGLGLLELPVRVPVVAAGVHHPRVEEEGVEVVGHVVVMRDGLGVVPLGPAAAHDGTSLMPKMESKIPRRRARLDPSRSLTTSRPAASGRRPIWRPSQPGSPAPYSSTICRA